MGIWDKIKKAIGIADNDTVEDADTEDNEAEQTEETEPVDTGEIEANQEGNAT